MAISDSSAPSAKFPARLFETICSLTKSLYPKHDPERLASAVVDAFWGVGGRPRKRGRTARNSLWDEKDAYVITYGDSIQDGVQPALRVLHRFLAERLQGTVKGVHVLPYFPYTSDDGFSVADYRTVNDRLGSWQDIERIGADFRLMSDLVLNHGSGGSEWFAAYLRGESPFDRFYLEAEPGQDLAHVVRPRAHALLRRVETARGPRHVWCTFSHDQIDFDFSNPEVLLEFLRILRLHISHGVRSIRLDAVAYVWKEVGTSCIHLRQTHELVRLLRLLADYSEWPIVLITETNVPNVENLSYFGNRNEAHMVYNFSLPPLILHALLSGTSRYLKAWEMGMPPAQLGCAYFNFTASHDGIGLRPAEGLLEEDELQEMIQTVQRFGGRVSLRQMSDGTTRPYELNVSFFDALKGTVHGEDRFQVARFLCSQAIAMALEGIPGFYIHSLLATPNDDSAVERTGQNRAINRHRWDVDALTQQLATPESVHARVFTAMKKMIDIRIRQPAFHPNATQFTLQLGDALFGFWRQSLDRSQSIFAVHNVSRQVVEISAMSLNLIDGDRWYDLLSGETLGDRKDSIRFAPYQCRWITNRK